MANKYWGWWVSSMFLAASLAAACSGRTAALGGVSSGGEAGSENARGGAAGAATEGVRAGAGGQSAMPSPGCRLDAVCDESIGRFLDCPKSLAEYVPDCSIFGGIEIVRYESACRGTLIEASDGIQNERWTFTPSGELVGTGWNGDVGDSACWGQQCGKLGAGTSLCGVGGSGGSGDGGAGGLRYGPQ